MRAYAESLLLHAAAFALVAGAVAVSASRLQYVGAQRHSAIVGVTINEPKHRAVQAHAVTHRRTEDAIVQKPASAAAVARKELNAISDTYSPGNAAYDTYLAAVRRQIDEALIYPASFRARRITGAVTLHLRLDRQGALRDAAVAVTSGNPELDRFALAAVRSAGPFPARSGGAAEIVSFNLPIELKMR